MLPGSKAGFLVNRSWDGIGAIQCAVKPIPFPVRTAICPLDGETSYPEKERLQYPSEKPAADHGSGFPGLTIFQSVQPVALTGPGIRKILNFGLVIR